MSCLSWFCAWKFWCQNFLWFFEALIFPTFDLNFTSLSHFNYHFYLLDHLNSYMLRNHRSPQTLIFRSQKIMFFMILGMKILGLKFCIFFLNICFFPTFHQNFTSSSLSIYSPRIVLHPKMSVSNRQTNPVLRLYYLCLYIDSRYRIVKLHTMAGPPFKNVIAKNSIIF